MKEDFFSENYLEARSRFLTACRQSGAEVESRSNPHARGPRDEELAIDFALFGRPEANRLLIAICGTHGPEGAAGSATMLQWIQRGCASEIADDVSVLFVHALNAYGWAHGSRSNEHNIDLNRNFLDHTHHPASPVYGELHALLMTDEMSDEILTMVAERFSAFAKARGRSEVMKAVNEGQYGWPTGLNYGGLKPAWSNETLRGELRRYLHGKTHVALIDWHTGLGSYGEPFFLCFNDENGPSFVEACRWWGKGKIRHTDGFEGGERPAYRGLVFHGVEAEVVSAGARMVGAVVEFGTYSMNRMLGALLMDRWLRLACNEPDSPKANWIRDDVRALFCPADAAWRRSVLRHGQNIYAQALYGLSTWS